MAILRDIPNNFVWVGNSSWPHRKTGSGVSRLARVSEGTQFGCGRIVSEDSGRKDSMVELEPRIEVWGATKWTKDCPPGRIYSWWIVHSQDPKRMLSRTSVGVTTHWYEIELFDNHSCQIGSSWWCFAGFQHMIAWLQTISQTRDWQYIIWFFLSCGRHRWRPWTGCRKQSGQCPILMTGVFFRFDLVASRYHLTCVESTPDMFFSQAFCVDSEFAFWSFCPESNESNQMIENTQN